MTDSVRQTWRLLTVGCVSALLLIALASGAYGSTNQEAGSRVGEAAAPTSAPVDTAKNQELEGRLIRSRSGGAGAVFGVNQGRASGTSGTSGLWLLWLQTIVVLAVVLGAMWLVLKWLRKRGIGASFGGSGSAVQVLNRGYLGGRHQMVLVRFGRRVLLLGVTPQSVNVLSEISNAEEASHVLAQLESAKVGSSSRDFQQAIAEATDEYTEPVPAGAPEPVVHASSQEQISQIRGEVRGLLEKMQSFGKGRKVD